MHTAALLNDFLQDGPKSANDIECYLENARKHSIGKLWVDCVIKPTFIAHHFLRAEREGDWLLQQHCLQQMLPYFFSAGHHHYARYMTYYLNSMKGLPQEARKDLMEGCHVCRHTNGAPAVSSDQFGEQTYIKQGKGSGGLKGISTDPELVAIWINSFNVCSHTSVAVDIMYNSGEEEGILQHSDEEDGHGTAVTAIHKEEGSRRKHVDAEDRRKLVNELEKHSHPLLTTSPKPYNIVNGQCAPQDINVHNALEIGAKQLEDYAADLPSMFHKTIERRVKTMQAMKKSVVVNGKPVYNIEAIFSRLLVVGQQRNVNLHEVFKYELSAVPPSIVDEFGCLRKGDKSVLVRRIAVPLQTSSDVSVVLIDGNQLLYHIVWPAPGTGQISDLAKVWEKESKISSEEWKLMSFSTDMGE